MKKIPLTKGYFATVDDADYDRLSKFKWHARVHKSGKAYAWHWRLGAMHRLILNAPEEKQVDHEDGDGLNNRRYNIRLATHAENMANRHFPKPASGFRGVEKLPSGKFRAQIGKGKTFWKGTARRTAEEAAYDYDQEAIRRYGLFTPINLSGSPL